MKIVVVIAVAFAGFAIGVYVWLTWFRRIPLAEFGLENVRRIGA